MKKLLTSVVAVAVSAIMLSGATLPAAAIEDFATFPYGVVVAENDTCLFFDVTGLASRQEVAKYMDSDVTLHAGDVLYCEFQDDDPPHLGMTEMWGFNSYYKLAGGDFVLKYVGRVEDVYQDQIKELTVIKTDCEGMSASLTLEDAEGKAYRWYMYYGIAEATMEEGRNPKDYQVGDVARFAVADVRDHGEVIYPIDPAPEHAVSTTKGDVDGNGTVDIMDVILLNRHIIIGAELSEQGRKNAMTGEKNDGAARAAGTREPDAVDSLNILKYIVGLIDEL